MNTTTRSLVFVVVASCVLLFVLLPRHDPLDTRADDHSNRILRRQFQFPTSHSGGNDGGGAASTVSTPTSTPDSPTTTPAASTSNPPAATTSTPQPQTSTTSQQTTQSTAAPTTNTQTTAAPASTAPSTSSPPNSPSSNGLTTTPAVGTQTLTQTETSDTSSSTSSAASSSTSSASSGSSGLSTGSIIGMSVAGGVALIGIIAFFVWKFTRKRFSDYDDNEAIKWPELNSHGGESVSGHALPTHATGRAGFGDDGESTVGGYASSLATTSTPELYPGAGPDPYAVPPLPHLNPNQPYHDEPVGYGRDPNSFYDPYKGPVPSTFNDTGLEAVQAQGYGAEAIPMTQMARTRSPGPQMGYDMAPQPGRQSPGPNLSYGNQMMEAPGRQASPGPYPAYGGR